MNTVSRLRKQLPKDHILPISGVGYMLADDEDELFLLWMTEGDEKIPKYPGLLRRVGRQDASLRAIQRVVAWNESQESRVFKRVTKVALVVRNVFSRVEEERGRDHAEDCLNKCMLSGFLFWPTLKDIVDRQRLLHYLEGGVTAEPSGDLPHPELVVACADPEGVSDPTIVGFFRALHVLSALMNTAGNDWVPDQPHRESRT